LASNKFSVGVDLGGTSIKFGLVSQDGKIQKKMVLPTFADKGPAAVTKQIKKGVTALLKNNSKKIQGIGIGAPGTVKLKKGTVEYPPNFPNWGRVHLGKNLEKLLKKNVYVENDANAAAIGELIFGIGKKTDSFIMVTLGTGVGGGIVFERKLFRGETGGAGEIGHVTIDINGKHCNCGSYGCVEAYIGNNYMISDAEKLLADHKESGIQKILNDDMELLTPKVIYDAANAGDEFSINFIKQLGTKLGYGLVSAINILDIATVVVGGGVAGFDEFLFIPLEAAIKERVLKPLKNRIKVKHSKLKNEAGIKGAAALVFYSQFN